MRTDSLRIEAFINEVELSKNAVISFIEDFSYFENKCPLRILTINEFDTKLKDIDLRDDLKIRIDVYRKNRQEAGGEYILITTNNYKGIPDHNYLNLSKDELELYIEGRDNGGDVTSGEMVLTTTTIRFLLLEENHTLFNTEPFNGVFENFTMTSIIALAYSTMRKDKNIKLFLSKPDNKEIYPETIIKPMGFKQLINWLDDTFTIYKNKWNLFHQDKSLYLLSMTDETDDKPFAVNIIGNNNFVNPYLYGFDDKNTIHIDESTELAYRGDRFEYLSENKSYIDSESSYSTSDKLTDTMFESFVNHVKIPKDNDKKITELLTLKINNTDIYDLVKPYSKIAVSHRNEIAEYRIYSYKRIYINEAVVSILNLYP